MQKKIAEVLGIAIPSIISHLLLFMQEIINLVFVGHLNDPAIIAAVGLGNAYIALIGLSLIVGMNGALDTLCSHACKDILKCKHYLRQSRIIMTMCFIPISFMLYFSDKVLLFLEQPQDVSNYASIYCLTFLPGLYLMGLIDGQRRFMVVQRMQLEAMFIQVIGILAHIAANYYFVDIKQLGIVGTGLAGGVTNLTVFLFLQFYSNFKCS